MADHDGKSSEFKTKKAKVVDRFVFLLLLLGAIAMVFPLIYMFLSSFMTKNQILSANFSIIPDPWKFGKYAVSRIISHWADSIETGTDIAQSSNRSGKIGYNRIVFNHRKQ